MADGAGDAERLVVLLEARIRDFEKNMAKASGTATRDFNRMRSTSRSATRQMEADMARSTRFINNALASTSTRMGTFTKSSLAGLTAGFLGAVAPILSVASALSTAKRALDDFGALDDKAQMLGLDVERLQEFHYAAEQAGMSADSFDMGLRRLTRRAAEAAQGTGAAKDAFADLGISLLDNDGKLKSNEQLLREVADAMRGVPDQAEKLRLAFKLFDSDGAAMLGVLEGGSSRLDEFARKARDLGIVVDRDLIAKAAQLGDELDTATTIMDVRFKQAMVDLAPVLIGTANLAGDVAAAIGLIVDQFRDIDDRIHLRPLQNQLAETVNRMVFLKDEIARMENGPNIPFVTDHALISARAELEKLGDEALRYQERIAQLLGKPKDGLPPRKPAADNDGSSYSPGRNQAAEDALKQAEAVKQLVANLDHERAQLGRTSDEQELYNALKSVGVTRESEFGQAIEGALRPLQRQREAIEADAAAMAAMHEAIATVEGLTKDFVGGMVADMRSGVSATEALGNSFQRLGDKLLDITLDTAITAAIQMLANLIVPGSGSIAGPTMGGSGGLSNVVRDLLRFDEGGYTGPGPKLKPAGIVHAGEVVWSQRDVARHGGPARVEAMRLGFPGYSDGGVVAAATSSPMGQVGTNLTYAPTIDARGADVASVARLERVLARDRAEFESRVIRVVQSGRRGRYRIDG